MARLHRPASPFADHLELAEAATLGVTVNLEYGDPHVAAALQPVARAAWALVADGHGEDVLLREAVRARRGLRLACLAQRERRLLDAVIVHLARRPARPAPQGRPPARLRGTRP